MNPGNIDEGKAVTPRECTMGCATYRAGESGQPLNQRTEGARLLLVRIFVSRPAPDHADRGKRKLTGFGQQILGIDAVRMAIDIGQDSLTAVTGDKGFGAAFRAAVVLRLDRHLELLFIRK